MKQTISLRLGLSVLLCVSASSHSQAQSSRPILSIDVVDPSSFALSWLSTPSGFSLQSAEQLEDGGSWQSVAQRPSVSGDKLRLVLTPTNSARFFRLQLVDTGLPPDPALVATPLNDYGVIDLRSATAFLYSGANPIQTGVTDGTIDFRRAAVLRGKVMQRDNSALSGVTISVLNNPALGQTISRADGMFDMAVNGGAELTVDYKKTGYCPVQRQVNPVWQDYTTVADVVMVELDPLVTAVALGTASPMQVARGSPQTDSDGTRQATIILPAGNSAQLVMPNGSTQAVSSLNIRATEFTVGANGPTAMPAPLPPASGYTYCAELSADEAIAVGATSITFDQPLYFYLENFLKFPTGMAVPTGYYDRVKGVWIAAPNGRVIKVLAISGGLAALDIDGDGSEDTGAQLATLGITAEERQRLAAFYPTGQTLWRTPISHFTPWDCNWPYGPPPDSRPPQQPDPTPDPQMDDPEIECNSIIEAQNQVLGESLAVAGTSFSLNYRSDRVPGRKAAYMVDIPLSGATVPTSVVRIDLIVSVAGRTFSKSFSAAANQSYRFNWDGKDAYGRLLSSAVATVRIGYVYPLVYQEPSQFGRGFDALSGVPISGLFRGSREFTLWQESRIRLGDFSHSFDVRGWSLSPHHFYDSSRRLLYYGDGRRRSAQHLSAIIRTVAGDGTLRFSGDGKQGVQAALWAPQGIAVSPDGAVYIADFNNNRIRRVGTDGVITTVAGSGTFAVSGDGGSALQAALMWPTSVGLAPDGSFYITHAHRIRRVDPAGIINTVAGNGTAGFSGDGGLATQATLSNPGSVTIANGSVYFADRSNSRIRTVGPDGIIRTIAGNGTAGLSGDGGPAFQATLADPAALAISEDGSICFSDAGNKRIRRIGPDGIITTVAGGGEGGFDGLNGDGGPATSASLIAPMGLSVTREGTIYFTDGRLIRRILPDGIISAVAGNLVRHDPTFAGDNGPATQATLFDPKGVAVAPDGSIYIADTRNNRIRQVSPRMGGLSSDHTFISSEDGTELYEFSSAGLHLRTIDSLIGSIRYAFQYNLANRLASIIDGYGSVTSIERDSTGKPTAILAADGQRNVLGVSANDDLISITNPAGEAYHMEYSEDGLLIAISNPNRNRSVFTYDATGRLIKDQNAANGFWTLNRGEQNDGHTVTITSAEKRADLYQIVNLPTGDLKRIHRTTDGTTNLTTIQTDGTRTTTRADGTIITEVQGPNPRFGMDAPITSRLVVKVPSGLTTVAETERTAILGNPPDLLSLTGENTRLTLNGNTYNLFYDAAIRQYTFNSPAGREGIVKIDTRGRRVLDQITGLEPWTYSYDGRGRVISVKQGSGSATRRLDATYNAQGYLATITDSLGRTHSLSYGASGRVTQETLPGGGIVRYQYDSSGNVTSIIPPGRPAHTFSYTPVNLRAKYVPPNIGFGPPETSYSYNLDKQLSSVTQPGGKMINIDYTGSGCNCGSVNSFTQGRGTTSYTYDPLSGKITTISAPDGANLAYAYDGPLLTRETWSGPVTGSVSRTYDNSFRITALELNAADSVVMQYDADGLLIQAGALTLARTPQNGLITGTTLAGMSSTLSYNGFGEPTNLVFAFSGAKVYEVHYTLDPVGRISHKTETSGGATDHFSYTYDMAGRLSTVVKNSAAVASYSYDTNGNRLSFTGPGGTVSGLYDNQDRLIQYGANSYTYTANGELLTKVAGVQVTSYEYDALGNLVSVVLPNGSEIRYVIDGRNRRIGKELNGVLVQGFLYENNLRPVAQLNGQNAIISRFIYATRSNVPDYMVKAGVTYRIVADHVGSPLMVIDVATGTIAQRVEYDEFGKVRTDTNPGFQPFGFAGGLYDSDTGLVRFGVRDYDPETGRWTAKDPILFDGRDYNLYGYAGNDPINWNDPTGNFPPLAGILVVVGTGAAVTLIIDIYRGKPLGDTLKGLWTKLVPLDDAVELAIDPDMIKNISEGDFSTFNPERRKDEAGTRNQRKILKEIEECAK